MKFVRSVWIGRREMNRRVDEDTKIVLLQRDFLYEVKTIEEDFKILKPRGFVFFEPILESFLMHSRNLYEFFYVGGNGDKARASHFVKEWIKTPPDEIKKWIIRINQYLSHLSYNRVIEKYKPWDITFIYGHFKSLITEFLSGVPNSYLSPELKILLK